MFGNLLILATISIVSSVALENYNFNTKENHSISLGKNVVDVDLESNICRFEPSSPNLVLVSNVSVVNYKSQGSSNDEVFNRIRDLEAEKAEFFAVLDNCIFILRGHNNIVLLSKTSMKIVNQYAISQLQKNVKTSVFKSNNSVLIILAGNLFICNETTYTSLPYYGTVDKAVSLNSTMFAVVSSSKVQVYVIGTTSVRLKQVLNHEDIQVLHKNIKTDNISFEVCKAMQQTLYCLCRNTGLYLIDINKVLMIGVIKKQKCTDFVTGNNSVFFKCQHNQDYFVSNYPDTKILIYFPSYIHSMQMLDKDFVLFQLTSKLTFWNPRTKKQKQINLFDHIVQTQIISQPFTPTNSLGLSILTLFKGYINKYQYHMTTPQLVCFSNKPVKSHLSLQLQITDNSVIQKQIYIQINDEVKSVNKKLIIVLCVVLGSILIVMAFVYCYYEKIVRHLRGMYEHMNRARRNGGVIQV